MLQFFIVTLTPITIATVYNTSQPGTRQHKTSLRTKIEGMVLANRYM